MRPYIQATRALLLDLVNFSLADEFFCSCRTHKMKVWESLAILLRAHSRTISHVGKTTAGFTHWWTTLPPTLEALELIDKEVSVFPDIEHSLQDTSWLNSACCQMYQVAGSQHSTKWDLSLLEEVVGGVIPNASTDPHWIEVSSGVISNAISSL
jgi:hypothetical protein